MNPLVEASNKGMGQEESLLSGKNETGGIPRALELRQADSGSLPVPAGPTTQEVVPPAAPSPSSSQTLRAILQAFASQPS